MIGNIEEMIERNLICIDNAGFEDRLTIGSPYISLYDYMFNTYCISLDDKNGQKQLYNKKLFNIIN